MLVIDEVDELLWVGDREMLALTVIVQALLAVAEAVSVPLWLLVTLQEEDRDTVQEWEKDPEVETLSLSDELMDLLCVRLAVELGLGLKLALSLELAVSD